MLGYHQSTYQDIRDSVIYPTLGIPIMSRHPVLFLSVRGSTVKLKSHYFPKIQCCFSCPDACWIYNMSTVDCSMSDVQD